MTMQAVVTMGQGGYEQLAWRQVPRPRPGPGEVLLQVLAAGVNNTDINTRVGWYGAAAQDTGAGAPPPTEATLSGWQGATPFPLIQGADCCGRVVARGAGVPEALQGRRVLVQSCMPRSAGGRDSAWLGTDFDGAFAQFVKVSADAVHPVETPWSDAELATIPCAYGTAENMLQRAGVGPGDRVLVPGASGGVGSAVVQLARLRGAEVLAVTTRDKADALRALGAQQVFAREDPLDQRPGPASVDVVVDNVGGAGFATRLRLLRRGGRYVTSGAIAGADVPLDLRALYLQDRTLFGCTAWDAGVFARVVQHVERAALRPLVAGVFPLAQIADAQRAFLTKAHVGNFVLLPPPSQE